VKRFNNVSFTFGVNLFALKKQSSSLISVYFNIQEYVDAKASIDLQVTEPRENYGICDCKDIYIYDVSKTNLVFLFACSRF
jgi:hypothetical protein